MSKQRSCEVYSTSMHSDQITNTCITAGYQKRVPIRIQQPNMTVELQIYSLAGVNNTWKSQEVYRRNKSTIPFTDCLLMTWGDELNLIMVIITLQGLLHYKTSKSKMGGEQLWVRCCILQNTITICHRHEYTSQKRDHETYIMISCIMTSMTTQYADKFTMQSTWFEHPHTRFSDDWINATQRTRPMIKVTANIEYSTDKQSKLILENFQYHPTSVQVYTNWYFPLILT